MIKKILLVEDNGISAEIYTEMLTDEGYHVDWAEDGTYALEMISAKPDYYDLILMDIQMPKLNGYDTSIQLRKRGIKVPIVAMSANIYSENSLLVSASGMNDYIAKPLTIAGINRVLKHIQEEK